MDYFDIEFAELPSIAPNLMFEEEPLPPSEALAAGLTPVQRETLLHFALDDHAYAKPYPTHSSTDNKCVTPMTVLKLHQTDEPATSKYKRNESRCQSHGSEDDDDIDVVSVDDASDTYILKYDKTKAHNGMNEVESYLNSLWKDVDKDDDEKIMKANWSKEQAGFFEMVYKLITNYQLAKISYYSNTNEPVLRKLALDKATKRVRKAFGSVLWNPKLIVWLHSVMIDGLGSSLFLCYLEILQSLKRKAPALFERILLFDKVASDKELSLPNLGVRLKKSWEPSTGLQSKVSMDKLPSTPFLIIVPSGPSIPHQSTKRSRFWTNQLSNFSKVFPINVPAYRTLEGYVIKHYLEHCISTIRSKITELRNRFPERHIVLVGWGVGSFVSLKVANVEKVDAIVCLGFPTNGIDGEESEEYWKGLAKIDCPVLFFIGTHAATNSVNETERLRRLMKTQTNLIIIEGAEELLRLPTLHKRALGMTQNMIDKLIQDQIYLFLKSVLFKPKPITTPVSKGPTTGKKRKKKVDIVEKGETKKRKKLNVKSSPILQDVNENLPLLPLDVSISSASPNPIESSQGLLTTGSVSTYHVTRLQNESLSTVTCADMSDVIVNTANESVKRTSAKEFKEKIKKGKSSKTSATKNLGISPGLQKAAADVGNQQSSTGESQSNKNTFQRIPTGTFVLSGAGASGQVRLQGASNILYLQQATSGTTQLLSPVAVNTTTTSSMFTAVMSTSTVSSNPTKINIVAASNFKFGPVAATHNKGLSAVISSGGCGSLVLATTTSQSPSPDVSPSVEANVTSVYADNQQPIPAQLSISTNNFDTHATESSVLSSSTTTPATSTTSTIMTHLSANDLRYLASLIAKHTNSRPNSPVGSPVLSSKTDAKSLKNSQENSSEIKISVSATPSTSEGRTSTNKSSVISLFDKKLSLTPSNQSTKKGVHPSLMQRVATIQQKDQIVKMKSPRVKTSKLSTSMPIGHIISTSMTKGSTLATNSKVMHKVPVTLTIPISMLQTNINLSSSLSFSKSINVPVLSQEKILITSTKTSESLVGSRTIVANTPPVTTRSSITAAHSPLGSNTGKLNNMALFQSSRAPIPSSGRTSGGIFLTKTPFASNIKSPIKGSSPSPITLHVPSQATLRDPNVLRKAVSDVKVVGVLSHQSKSQMTSLVNLSALRSISNPSSPLPSPPGDLYGDISPEELSQMQARQYREEVKSEDGKKTTFSPLKKSNISGKAGSSTFPGKLFGAPKSIGDPTWGKISFTKNPNQQSALETYIGEDSDDDRNEDIDEYQHDDDDDSDVDFAISPGSPAEESLGTVFVNKPVLLDSVKRSNVTKTVYSSNHANDHKSNTSSTNLPSKSVIDIARAKLRETQFRSSGDGKSLSVNTLKVSSLEEHTGSLSVSDSKVQFEPLKISNTRAKLTSVLSKREGSTTNTIVPKISNKNDFNKYDIVPNQPIKSATTVPSLSLKPLTSLILCNSESSRGLHMESSEEITRDSTASLSTINAESSQHLSRTNASIRYSASTNGVTSHEVKELPFPSIYSKGSMSISEINDTSNLKNKLASLGNIGDLSFSTLESTGMSFTSTDSTSLLGNSDKGRTVQSVDAKGIPFAKVESEATTIETTDSKEAHFTNIETKCSYLGAVLTKSTTIVTNANERTSPDVPDTKGDIFHSIETKWPFVDTESNKTSVANTKAKGPYYHESTPVSKLYDKPSKPTKDVSAYKIMIEEEPHPYITRSGRVKRSKYSIQYINELDPKKPAKKRRSQSTARNDDVPSTKKNKTPEVSQMSAVTLESLVVAAEVITKDSNLGMNGSGDVGNAATAVLELLSAHNSGDKSALIQDDINVDTHFDKESHSDSTSEMGGTEISCISTEQVLMKDNVVRNTLSNEEKTQISRVLKDNECATNMSKGLHMNECSTELTLKEKTIDAIPESSPPALAIIQRNVHNNQESSKPDNSDVQSTCSDTLEKPLPPLVAIHSSDCDGLITSDHNDTSLLQEPDTTHVEPSSMSSIFETSTTCVVSEIPGNESILVDRTDVSDDINIIEEEIS